MALSEEQIVRYSRQILLRDVGGKGQVRLLETPVQVEGKGGAARSAAEYLRAGGTPVLSAEDLASAKPSASPLRLRVAADRIAVKAAGGCDACFDGAASSAQPSDSVALGALGALIAQRVVLGLSADEVSVFDVDESTLQVSPQPTPRCAHR